MAVAESELEDWVLEMLADDGWQTLYGPSIAPGSPAQNARTTARSCWSDGCDRRSIERLNPELPVGCGRGCGQDGAPSRVAGGPDGELAGLPVADRRAYRSSTATPTGRPRMRGRSWSTGRTQARTTCWRSTSSRFRARPKRRPDVVLFVNGLPLGLLELKKPGRAERDDAGGVQPGPDLPGPDSRPVHVEPGHGDLGRHPGPGGDVHGPVEPLRAVEDHRRHRLAPAYVPRDRGAGRGHTPP